MITLTYGFKKPESGDKGSVFFPALEDNIDRLDGHTHNGVNSPKIDSNSVDAVSQTLLLASWALVSTDYYRQLVTMPGAFEFDKKTMAFVIASGANDGHLIYPSIEKVSTNTFYVYINDSSVDLKVIYS